MMTWIEFVRLILVADKSRSAKRSDEAISLEQLAKFLTAASAVCFAIGVVCTSIYFASVSLRPFDPISFQQIFLGVLFLTLVVLTLVIPARSGTRVVAGWAIQVATILCLVFDQVFINQLAYVLGAGVLHVQEQYFFSIISNKIVGLLGFLIAAGAFRLLVVQLSAKQSNSTKSAVAKLSIGLAASLVVFSTNVYPRIPLALGGGDFPIVRVEFTEGTPYQVTMNFDVSNSDPKYQGYRYYARLIHREKDLAYLSSPFWFSSTVFEVRSKDILMLEYGSFNPTTYILPKE